MPQLRVGRDYRLSGESVRRAITRNTVLVVASAPGFPHGVMDHVADIAAVSRAQGHASQELPRHIVISA